MEATADVSTSTPTMEDPDATPVMPPHSASDDTATEVEMKPHLQTESFSPQNAYFFAYMSKIVYKLPSEAEELLVGNKITDGLGFDRFYWFEAGEDAGVSLFDTIHDTQAFIAANDEMIAVVFRGTKEPVDWTTNLVLSWIICPEDWGLPAPGGNLHQGFNDALDSVWELRGMYEVVKGLYHEEGKSRKLFLAGHSLGGALATIAAARLAFVDDINISGMYTIGSPRVFDDVAADYFDRKMNHGTKLMDKYFRCKNNNDVVSRIPPWDPYTHVGTEIYLDRFGTISINGLVDRLLGRFSAMLRGEFIDGISDHATSEYMRIFKQIVINSRVPAMEKARSVMADTADSVIEKFSFCSRSQEDSEASGNSQRLTRLKQIQEHIEKVKTRAREAARSI